MFFNRIRFSFFFNNFVVVVFVDFLMTTATDISIDEKKKLIIFDTIKFIQYFNAETFFVCFEMMFQQFFNLTSFFHIQLNMFFF